MVGLAIQHVHVERPVVCRSALQCPDSCNLGYKCGPDGCPTCECLVAVTTTYQQGMSYRKNPKISDTRKFAVITLKVEQDGFSLE